MKVSDEQVLTLISDAFCARKQSYCDYSGFAVGAALLTAGDSVYMGCNIENASYGASNCAERTAFFKAVSEGHREFKAIAIVGGPKTLQEGEVDFCAPCGICRQVMLEFCRPDFIVVLAKSVDDFKIYSLEELMPQAFCADDLATDK